jgi:hypothetical protein
MTRIMGRRASAALLIAALAASSAASEPFCEDVKDCLPRTSAPTCLDVPVRYFACTRNREPALYFGEPAWVCWEYLPTGAVGRLPGRMTTEHALVDAWVRNGALCGERL